MPLPNRYYFGAVLRRKVYPDIVILPCAFLVIIGRKLGVGDQFLVSDWIGSCFNHAAGFFTDTHDSDGGGDGGFSGGNFRIARWEPWMVWGWFLQPWPYGRSGSMFGDLPTGWNGWMERMG